MEDERRMLLRIIEGQNMLLQTQAEQIKALTEKIDALVKGAEEQRHQNWAKSMQNLLMEIHESRNILMSQKETRFQTLVLEAYLLRYDSVIRQGMAENPMPQKPKGKHGRTGKGKVLCLLERLRDYRGDVLRFAADWTVPFTNNEAERTICFSKVKQKVSGCFRTEKGAEGLYADHELCQYGQETRNVLF